MVTKIIDLCQLKGGQSDDKNDWFKSCSFIEITELILFAYKFY